MGGIATLGCYCCLLNALLGLGVFDVPERFSTLEKPVATLLVTVVAAVTFAAAWQVLTLAKVPKQEAARVSDSEEALLGKARLSTPLAKHDIPELPGLVNIGLGQSRWAIQVAFVSLLLCVIYLMQVSISLSYHFARYLSVKSSNPDSWSFEALLGFILVAVVTNLFSIKQLQWVHITAALLRFVFIGLLITFNPSKHPPPAPSSSYPCLALPIFLITFQYHLPLPQILNAFSPGASVKLQVWVVGTAWILAMLLGWMVPVDFNLLEIYCDPSYWDKGAWQPLVFQVLIAVQMLSCVHIHLRVLGGILIGKIYDPNLEYARDTHPHGVRLIYLMLPLVLCSFPLFHDLVGLSLLKGVKGVDSAAVGTLALVFLLVPYCYLKKRGGKATWMERIVVYSQYCILLASVVISVWSEPSHFALLFLVAAAGVMLLLLVFEFLFR